MNYRKFQNPKIEFIFNNYPKKIKGKLLHLRELIFTIADKSDIIGDIEETLKWQDPSYLTHAPKSGTTIRLSALGSDCEKYTISVHCQTSLVSEFKEIHPELSYDGNRSIIFDVNHKLPVEKVSHFIFLALTYHQRKKDGMGI